MFSSLIKSNNFEFECSIDELIMRLISEITCDLVLFKFFIFSFYICSINSTILYIFAYKASLFVDFSNINIKYNVFSMYSFSVFERKLFNSKFLSSTRYSIIYELTLEYLSYFDLKVLLLNYTKLF